MAGAVLLAEIFENMGNVQTSISHKEWPKNEQLLRDADVIVIYSNGDGKQGFLASESRVKLIDKLIEQGKGFVNLHASVSYPKKYVEIGQKWIGGVWVDYHSKIGRGHWKSEHKQFPKHEITEGVTPWKADDGWCHKILFSKETRPQATPLLWSSRTHKGNPKGGDDDVVAWSFERKDGGRSFSCSGAHGHWEWANDGLRQMIVNGILWTAKKKVPVGGFNCVIDKENMNRYFDTRKKK
ncbi:MAG: ThuA domain-containing protein [Lentisphaeraceae bacterium]|nr:ThuA domain-containing protein [Lentisphaeraceae bacterium]